MFVLYGLKMIMKRLGGIKRLRQGELDDEAHTDWETEQGRGYIMACDRIKKIVSGDEG